MGKRKKQLSDESLVMAYRIREARAKKYKTIKDAAQSLPVEKTLWSHWESARVRPQKSTMEKIAALLGVPVESFSRKPENWENEKGHFLAELTNRTRVKKDYYKEYSSSLPNAEGESLPKAGEKPGNPDPLSVFLQITRLITDAQTNVLEGRIPQEAYNTHMRMIADMVKISLLARK